jgi:hypothetical protein
MLCVIVYYHQPLLHRDTYLSHTRDSLRAWILEWLLFNSQYGLCMYVVVGSIAAFSHITNLLDLFRIVLQTYCRRIASQPIAVPVKHYDNRRKPRVSAFWLLGA